MQTLFVEGAPEAIGPYCHAVRSGPFYFLSGQTPLNESGELVGETIEEQTGRVLYNISTVLNGLGLGLIDVVKTTVKQDPLGAFVQIECIAEADG